MSDEGLGGGATGLHAHHGGLDLEEAALVQVGTDAARNGQGEGGPYRMTLARTMNLSRFSGFMITRAREMP